MRGRGLVRSVLLPAAIFAWACWLRVHFFAGFILCDDAQELATVRHVLAHGPSLNDQFHLRFGVWLFNVLAFRLLGVSETSFFLPTVLMSASFAPLGFCILRRWGYGALPAALAGIVIASAPFEVLTGTLRANDVILAWLLGLALLAYATRARPVLQGIVGAALLWLGFYVKLWVIYVLPVLGVYYLDEVWRLRRWRGAVSFTAASLLLHAATCVAWKRLTVDFVPFIHSHAATYPVPHSDLARVLRIYPDFVFRGSEFGTTLFGSVPYVLLALLAAKAVATLVRRGPFRLDARDGWLFAYYMSFFLILEFFPNSFVFDQYYSAPRIFRYLAPISFPLALHLGKLLLDVARIQIGRVPGLAVAAVLALGMAAVSIRQTAEAARPGLAYRRALLAAVEDIRAARPPRLVTEAWLSFFLDAVYLPSGPRATPIWNTYPARQYEEWLRSHQDGFPDGTMLLTGIGSCVHYGAHGDGFRLRQFQAPLDPAWKRVKEYGVLDYLPVPEPVTLWRLSRSAAPAARSPTAVDLGPGPDGLFREGMAGFDRGDCPAARPLFAAVVEHFPDAPAAPDALYFHTVCAFRAGEWEDTIAGFERLEQEYPRSRWTGGAWYHIGVAQAALGQPAEARASLEYVREHFPGDVYLVRLATEQLEALDARPGILEKMLSWLRGS